jgi:transcriptional regulator with XRE-family HTH domain
MIQSNLKTVQVQGADELLQCLPKALRLIREGLGYRQTDVAERSGLTKAMLSSYETGKTQPSLGSLTTLLAAIGKDFADFQNAINMVRGVSSKRQPTEKELELEVGQVVLKALKAIQNVMERKGRDATSGSARDGGEA